MNKIKILLFILLLGLLAFVRPINHDESYYSISANLLLNGEKPFTDYLFHQLPLMLYVYTLVSWHGFWSLIAGRLLSYALYLAALYLIQKYLVVLKPGKMLLFIFIFLLNLFLLNWIFIIKIYALAILLLTAGCINVNKFIEEKERDKRYIYLFFAGLFFSLLLLTRIVFAANLGILFVYIIYLLYKLAIPSKLKHMLAFIMGSVIPIAVFALIYRNDFYNIYINTVYLNDVIRTDQVENFIKSFIAYQYVLFLPQNLIMILIILTGRKKFSLIELFYLINIIAFYIIHIFTQMYLEYLVPVLPLLFILAYNRYDEFENKVSGFFKIRKKAFSAGFLVFFLLVSPFGITHFKHIIEGRDVMFSPLALHKVSNELNETEGATLLAGWEGYSFYSSKISIVKNQYWGSFFFYLKGKIDSDIASKILFPEDYRSFIINKVPDIIVYDENDPRYLKDMKQDILNNYNENKSTGSIKIFRRK